MLVYYGGWEVYYIKKKVVVSASHWLELPYESLCTKAHGHNWTVYIYCAAHQLDGNGMVIDFAKIKALINDKLDHQCLNDVFDFNPTAENIARWVVNNVEHCYKATIVENEGSEATYDRKQSFGGSQC